MSTTPHRDLEEYFEGCSYENDFDGCSDCNGENEAYCIYRSYYHLEEQQEAGNVVFEDYQKWNDNSNIRVLSSCNVNGVIERQANQQFPYLTADNCACETAYFNGVLCESCEYCTASATPEIPYYGYGFISPSLVLECSVAEEASYDGSRNIRDSHCVSESFTRPNLKVILPTVLLSLCLVGALGYWWNRKRTSSTETDYFKEPLRAGDEPFEDEPTEGADNAHESNCLGSSELQLDPPPSKAPLPATSSNDVESNDDMGLKPATSEAL